MIFAIFLACTTSKDELSQDAGVTPSGDDIKLNVVIDDVKSPRKPKEPGTPKTTSEVKESTEAEQATEATETSDSTKAKTTESESSTR